jgi:DNA-binding IclR family transcriptional regulator
VLVVVGVEHGISVREVVAQLGVNRTSLYPVVRQLVSDGLLHKDGRGLWPAAR